MRILQVLSGAATGVIRNSRIWFINLHEPLKDLGHEVYLVDPEKFRLKRGYRPQKRYEQDQLTEAIRKTFKKEHARQPFDLFFSYLADDMVYPDLIDDIRKSGVPTVNFSCNNVHQFNLVDEISSHFDYCVHTERDVAHKFKDVGANPIHMQEAANPNYYKPYQLEREYDVTFVGQRYGNRPEYIWYLLENGINVHTWGPGWQVKAKWLQVPVRRMRNIARILLTTKAEKRCYAASLLAHDSFREFLHEKFGNNFHPPLEDEELIKMYSRSKISLGFCEVFHSHFREYEVDAHLRLRDFEAPMSGGLYCVGYTRELEDFFIPDEEVIVYRNKFELLDKVKYYLKHPKEAEQIRIAGLKRARECHTWHKRFQDLFAQIGLY